MKKSRTVSGQLPARQDSSRFSLPWSALIPQGRVAFSKYILKSPAFRPQKPVFCRFRLLHVPRWFSKIWSYGERKFQVAGCKLQVASSRFQVPGYWFQVGKRIEPWSLAAGDWGKKANRVFSGRACPALIEQNQKPGKFCPQMARHPAFLAGLRRFSQIFKA